MAEELQRLSAAGTEAAQDHGRSTNRLSRLTLLAAGLFLSVYAAFLGSSPRWAMLSALLLLGWSEVIGRCGASHVSTITPLAAVDAKLWRRSALAYTLGGILSSLLVGALLGLVGNVTGVVDSKSGILALALGAVLLAAKAVIRPDIALPQVHRQTDKMWAFEFGIVPAAAMWGTHIGLGLVTVVVYGGVFVAAGLAILSGPLLGALIFSTFWIGRALPIWIGPRLHEEVASGDKINDVIHSDHRTMDIVAALGLACVGIATVTLLA